MAEPAAQAGNTESMEDILQSIKRIIEDEPGAKSETESDVLDLTQVVKDDGTTTSLPPVPKPKAAPQVAPAEPTEDVVKSIDAMFAAQAPQPAATPAEVKKPTPSMMDHPLVVAPDVAPPAPPESPASIETRPKTKPYIMEDGLMSDEAAHAAAAALKPITESAHKDYSIPQIPSASLRGGSTVEDLILEALKPMLKAWLDEHLPTIVQKIVEKEVKRIVTFHQD